MSNHWPTPGFQFACFCLFCIRLCLFAISVAIQRPTDHRGQLSIASFAERAPRASSHYKRPVDLLLTCEKNRASCDGECKALVIADRTGLPVTSTFCRTEFYTSALPTPSRQKFSARLFSHSMMFDLPWQKGWVSGMDVLGSFAWPAAVPGSLNNRLHRWRHRVQILRYADCPKAWTSAWMANQHFWSRRYCLNFQLYPSLQSCHPACGTFSIAIRPWSHKSRSHCCYPACFTGIGNCIAEEKYVPCTAACCCCSFTSLKMF